MIELKNKSELNKNASIYLRDNNFYASSVHCAYYSTFQLIKFILLDKLNFNEQTFKLEQSQDKDGTHQFYFKKIKLQMNRNDVRDFNKNLNVLYSKRLEADYENIKIDCADSDLSISLNDKIQKQLDFLLNIKKK